MGVSEPSTNSMNFLQGHFPEDVTFTVNMIVSVPNLWTTCPSTMMGFPLLNMGDFPTLPCWL